MLRLALPVVLSELGWMAMGVVDTLMVGRLGPEAIGAVSVGRALFMMVGVFGIGMLLGLDTLVSQAFGAGQPERCRLALVQGTYLCLALAIPLTPLTIALGSGLRWWGVDPAVAGLGSDYVRVLGWSVLPIFLYAALRRYLQGMSLVRPVMFALLSANLVNVVGNWALIFGNLGLPALGVKGAAWSTFLSSCYMTGYLALAAVLHRRGERVSEPAFSLRFNTTLFARLLALGFPAAIQLLLEVGAFALATMLVARLDPFSLAAHQIALMAASVTYMVPLGISAAAAVRVGQALGRKEPRAAGAAGSTALLLAAGSMCVSALIFITLPRPLIQMFNDDAHVVQAGVTLLFMAALFQLFDGVQVVATGALRGAGDTRRPMIWNLVGYWILGLPVGYALCFPAGRGAAGMWVGLTLGLVVVGVVLLRIWLREVRSFEASSTAAR